MEKTTSFVAKVTKIKTRTKDEKEYFTFRINIPSDVSKKLGLTKDDFLYFSGVTKAKWYHMLKWKEMSKAWQMIPPHLKHEIRTSGMDAPEQEYIWLAAMGAPTGNPSYSPVEMGMPPVSIPPVSTLKQSSSPQHSGVYP